MLTLFHDIASLNFSILMNDFGNTHILLYLRDLNFTNLGFISPDDLAVTVTNGFIMAGHLVNLPDLDIAIFAHIQIDFAVIACISHTNTFIFIGQFIEQFFHSILDRFETIAP